MKFSKQMTPKMSNRKRRKLYFASLCAAMESEHDWKNLVDGSSGRKYRFLPKINVSSCWNIQRGECWYCAWFPYGGLEAGDTEVVTGLDIRNQALYHTIKNLKGEIESDFGGTLDWSQRLCRNPKTQKRKFVFTRHLGSIQSPEHELQEIAEWHIETLLKLDEVFTHRIERLFN